MLSMLAMAAMVSCTNEIETPDQPKVNQNEPVEIKVAAGVLGVETKAPIVDNSTFIPAIVGWEGTEMPTTGNPKWNTITNEAITAGSTAVAMPFTDKQYYNPDGTTHTYIRAFFPAATITNDAVAFTNTNADQDIMMTDIVDAGVKPIGTTSATSLTFSHLLTQLQFQVGGDASLPKDVKVKSITLLKATIPTGFNIISGELVGTEQATFKIPNLSETIIPIVEGATTETSVGDPIMIKPIGGTSFNITVETTQGTFSDVPVTLAETDANGGISYTIKLTFKQKEITATGKVTTWTQKTGSGTVE